MVFHQNTFSGHPTAGVPEYQPGTRIGTYDLLELLGQGGMGQVWKARDTTGNRLVALKLLPPEFRGNEEALSQIRSAFEAVHDLTHQGLCKVLALGDEPQHGPFVVMDYFPGITLSKYRRSFPEGRMPVDLVVRVLRPVAEALDFAHQKASHTGNRERRGVLHRDVKPQNIMLTLQGDEIAQVCVIDLGLAADIRTTTTRFTQASVDTRGTRPYMSPEQLTGKRSQWDGRTDQYSLAAVAYELLAGGPPFEADDDLLLIQAIKSEAPDPIDGLAPFLNAALLKGLSKNKDDRYVACCDFVDALAGQFSETDLSASIQAPATAVPMAAVPKVEAARLRADRFPDLNLDESRHGVEQGEKLAREARLGQLVRDVAAHIKNRQWVLARNACDELLALDPTDGKVQETREFIEARLPDYEKREGRAERSAERAARQKVIEYVAGSAFLGAIAAILFGMLFGYGAAEKWNATNERIWVWFKTPLLSDVERASAIPIEIVAACAGIACFGVGFRKAFKGRSERSFWDKAFNVSKNFEETLGAVLSAAVGFGVGFGTLIVLKLAVICLALPATLFVSSMSSPFAGMMILSLSALPGAVLLGGAVGAVLYHFTES
jgi:Protein kinase domain